MEDQDNDFLSDPGIEKAARIRLNSSLKIGFIGFGLIGGSIAKALKKVNPAYTIYAYDYHKDSPGRELIAARSDGILDEIVTSLQEGIPECDILFLCAPVMSNIEYLAQLKSVIKGSCIITDVGSVKGNIHDAASALGLEDVFIGGHPMTGSEKTGYLNSNSLMLENAYYILTPTSGTSVESLSFMCLLVKRMGSIPIILDYNEHDKITAAISHLPHIIAAQLVNLIRENDKDSDRMKTLAAGGFKDITRIASSSPVMWQNICLTNAQAIRSELESYISYLRNVSDALLNMDGEYLYNIFNTAGEYRSSIPSKAIGLMKKIFEIYMDIADETGAIASIASLLAREGISIKNIGIIHNREFEEGVLRIEFYEEKAMSNAVSLLKGRGYRIYER
jgi:prephenate dehydrogenase